MQTEKQMTVQELFASDVTRDIPPVIYFAEQRPENLQAEVSEYIITGGYEEGDPRHKRNADGIHEQFVRLLKSLGAELKKPGGADLPACWISGFYGSGKSSFAKLLGLSLDQRILPDGRPLSQALLERDDSPRAHEFAQAWNEATSGIDPMGVVFDIGGIARDDEHIHSAVARMVAERLGYCPESHYVAEEELKLESDGLWPKFLATSEETLGRPWDVAKTEQLAEDNFSEVMHAMFPNRYDEPTKWLDVKTGVSSSATSVEETVRAIEAMMKFRAPGKTLFLVVDEVSQYIHGNDNRMLKLQTFVAALGERLRGRVWLLATGQQKLEEDLEGSNLSKLKDRFPPRLRVHLAPTNIRDVVHRRLLKKKPSQEVVLSQLFADRRADLKLYGYNCADISESDFLEVYPMLPSQVDLLMQITSNLRARSTRMKGDDHGIRGLLQLLGELFREQKLGQKPLGALVTLDMIYDVQYTALDADVQNTMARLQAQPELSQDETAMRAAKAVALLELISDQEVTTPELVTRCLYPYVGAGSEVEKYRAALEKLHQANFLSLSEKTGYRIQSSAGSEWASERDSYSVASTAISQLIAEKLRELIGQANRPRYKNRSFPIAAYYSDSRGAKDERLQSPKDPAVVNFDFQYHTQAEDRLEDRWLKQSDYEQKRDRLLWVAGAPGSLESKARELIRSRHMVSRYSPRLQSLPEARKRLLFDEQNRQDYLEKELQQLVGEVFLDGSVFFRSRRLDTLRHGRSFPAVLQGTGEEILPVMYQHFTEISILDSELEQLMKDNLSGVSQKFLDQGLGLLKLDAGKYIPSCEGEIVSRVREHIKQQRGISGAALLSHFGGPPCGYPSDVVKACVLGLLRGTQLRIRLSDGSTEVTSVRDPGVQDLFRGDKEFRKAELFPSKEVIDARMRIAIRKFFNSVLDVDFEVDNEHIADMAFLHFPRVRERLTALQHRLNKLQPRPELPKSLAQLQTTLEKCMGSRLVEETVLAVHGHLDALRDGIQKLGVLHGDLTDHTLEALKTAQRVYHTEYEQLKEVGADEAVWQAGRELEEQMQSPQPWRDIGQVEGQVRMLQEAYRESRSGLLNRHEVSAESLREKVKNREGFSKLTDEQVSHVLRPIRDALVDTTPEAISPPLSYLRDSVPSRLKEAEAEANRRLDAILAELDKVQVVQFRTDLSGRELRSEQDVNNLLEELRERLLAQLQKDVRIRLIS
jgi:hypothetical protein